MKEEIKERLAQIRRGEIPDGYRRTKAGIIPHEWKSGQFGDVFQFIPNNTYSRALMTASCGEIRNVHYGDVLIKYHSIIDCGANDLPFLTDAANIRQAMFLKNGDIIIADTAEDLTAGKAVEIINIGADKVVSGLHTMACRPVKNQFAPKWLGYYMDSDAYHNQLIPLICGAKVSSISKREIINTTVAIPPLAEQQKIADILSAQDSVIELKERLISEKLRQKKYLMQRLLTGKQRLPGFCGEWKTHSLCDVTERKTIRNSVKCDRVLTISGQYGLIEQSNFFDKTVASSDKSAYFFLERDDFAYNKSRSAGYPFGAIKRLKRYDEGIVSPLYICFRISSPLVIVEYMEQCFEAGLINREIQFIAQEGARNHGLLNVAVDDFFHLKILLPPVKEQRAIADILSAADREIELLRASLEQEKRKKKSLSQLLLTGIVRV